VFLADSLIGVVFHFALSAEGWLCYSSTANVDTVSSDMHIILIKFFVKMSIGCDVLHLLRIGVLL
jgi:hypothetical protein